MPKISSNPSVGVSSFEAPRPSAPTSKPAGAPTTSGWSSASATSNRDLRRAEATSVTTAPAELSDAARAQVVQKKATCPFIGAAVNKGELPVLNNGDKPLASIDTVAALGNSGPNSNLGEVLKLFAQGNHARMPGASGKLDTPVPLGTFSLDFPGSQGSHAGHSGILMGDPTKPNSGRMSQKDFDRLCSYAKNGVISRSDIGKFIAGNIANDPNAKAPGLRTGLTLAKDAVKLLGQLGESLGQHAVGKGNPESDRLVFEKLTKVLGDDNLIGSAGEYGLLTAFLANSPKTTTVGKGLGSEPAYSVEDLKAMFVEKRLPDGWEKWTKSATDWVANTSALALSAEKAYLTR